VLDAASAIAMKLADDKHIFFCDVNAVYLESDGKIKKNLMPDWLHPNPEGAHLWAETMEPLLARLLNETPKPPMAPLP
jgi:lysophospholipase L1-like esterase